MSDTYKICFLGYKKLGELAHQVIEHLNYSDTTIILKECSIETLVQAVNEAISEGCQVFVAGSANAEEFKRRFYEHLIELHIDMSDYLYCLQRAKELGAKKIAVTVHRKSRKVDFDVLQSLTKIPFTIKVKRSWSITSPIRTATASSVRPLPTRLPSGWV